MQQSHDDKPVDGSMQKDETTDFPVFTANFSGFQFMTELGSNSELPYKRDFILWNKKGPVLLTRI